MKHCCREMTDYLRDEDEIMYYSKKYNEYLIPIHDGGTSGILIRYCPWCGKKVPESRRNKIFVKPRGKGIAAKQKQELENIRAGGKGSGVYSDRELEEIRKTGEFPKDIQWHHDPTVANRPDLASNPRSVHPIRGNRAQHRIQGHQGDWRKPYDE